MNQARLLADTGEVITVVCFIVSVLFTPVVSFFWPWWLHSYGRTMAAEAIALALAFLPSFLHVVFGLDVTSPAFRWFVMACIAAVPAILVWRAVSTWRIQCDGAAAQRAEHPEQPEPTR